MVYLRTADAVTLDPARAADHASAQVLANIFEGLVRFKPGTTEIEPCLAKSWDISPDGLQWTFHLRPGVTFQDGTPCNAGAVKYSVERLLSEQVPAPSPYATFVFGPVKSVDAPDNLTVRFTLRYPYAPFLHNLAMPLAAPVVSPAAVKKYGPAFAVHPVGTGPLMFQSWQPGGEIILTANPSYWGPKPSLPGVIFRVVADRAERLKELQNGRADVAEDVSPADLPALTGRGFQILRTTGLDISYLGFFTNKAPFSDPRLREAACRAIDAAAITAALFPGQAVTATGPLPPGVLGQANSPAQYSFDLAKARQDLAGAGYPDGINITMITYSGSRLYNPAGGEKLAGALAGQLERAGFHCRIKAYPWEEYKKALYREEGDAFVYGWTGDNGDPDNFLYALLASPQISCGLNASHYRNREVDTLLLTAQRTADPVLRAKIYHDALQQIVRDAPLYFLNHSLLLTAAGRHIQGLVIQPGDIPVLSAVHRK
ncbi:hypothetical protein A6M21_08555 [Desulfotomaculum copahuensis]|uniref:Solute-binding protein family 5 domain-containing protein n=1 Tax=Desulfotomaculum copahuensis TaxID=1838280 RepID=A0A1B7LFL3_9FIRM|nr:hypothetical protein A6M21_08555 [Desulfotomaculum copahuensis]